MADIKISNLSGSDLFNDAESFMSEINNEATDSIMGGLVINCNGLTANCQQGSICENNTVVNNPACYYYTYRY
jgi:hypothetical protein